MAHKLFFVVNGTGSDPFSTISDRLASCGEEAGQEDAARQYFVVHAPNKLLDNDYTATTDPSGNVVDLLAALQQDCRDAKANIPSTVGSDLGGFSDLV